MKLIEMISSRLTPSSPFATSLVAASLLFAIGALTASPAAAYERTMTCSESGFYECDEGQEPTPIYWPMRCHHYFINERGSDSFESNSEGEPSDALVGAIKDSFRAWNQPLCSDLSLIYGGLTSESEATYDRSKGVEGNQNIVVFREQDWEYSSMAFALTSVTFSSNSGVIKDADIEVNGVNYDFANLEDDGDLSTPPGKIDLRNTLTHEVGHFIGLDHPSSPEEATMYGNALAGETRKRTLHQDDIDGLCAIYPTPDDGRPAQCNSREAFLPPDARESEETEERRRNTMACSTTSGPLSSPLWALIAVGALVALRRRPRT